MQEGVERTQAKLQEAGHLLQAGEGRLRDAEGKLREDEGKLREAERAMQQRLADAQAFAEAEAASLTAARKRLQQHEAQLSRREVSFTAFAIA